MLTTKFSPSAWASCSSQEHSSLRKNLRRDATVKTVEKFLPTIVNIQSEIPFERRDFYNDLLWNFFGPLLPQTSLPLRLQSGLRQSLSHGKTLVEISILHTGRSKILKAKLVLRKSTINQISRRMIYIPLRLN
ncbi:MAG: hypothetical protein M2R45_02493 [Verrucomicrobia subdivision 3 bacterium]|nr:hypothetical protein [Limisphaerales bacterium]MCS1413283.1 hypothetical protein [Limisphaerales bacterium]